MYAPLGVEVGLNRIINLAREPGSRSGTSTRARPAACKKHVICPSYALGIPISPLSEAYAYGTFIDHGVHHPVRSVLSVRTPTQGQLFRAAAQPAGDRVMPATIADEVTTAMRAGRRSTAPGHLARQPFPVYGKTGTTDDFTDAWFTGCTQTLCITVWMGYDRPYHRVKARSLLISCATPTVRRSTAEPFRRRCSRGSSATTARSRDRLH